MGKISMIILLIPQMRRRLYQTDTYQNVDIFDFTSTWSLKDIVSIHNSECKYLMTNYCTIMMKVFFPNCLANWWNWSWTHELNKKRARIQAIFLPYIQYYWSYLDQWEKFCAFIDFKRAFDAISR